MNAVGIDVSKGKSMVAILRPFGEIVYSPFEIKHTSYYSITSSDTVRVTTTPASQSIVLKSFVTL